MKKQRGRKNMDRELRSLLAGNLDDHFRQLAQVYQQRLSLLALRLAGRPDDAEDIVQEAFLRAYYALKGMPTHKVSILNLWKWLYTITLHSFRNCRRTREQPAISLDLPENGRALDIADQALGPDEEASWHEWRYELEGYIASLPEHYRPAITLSLFEELRYTEIAEVLQQPVGTVKGHISRANYLLRQLLDPGMERHTVMEYKDDERPALNGHGAGKLESLQHAAVPATLLPTVLSRLGLGDRPMARGDRAVALRDEKSHVRVAAVRSLGECREVSALQFLMSALHDPAWEVRAAAVWALGAFGGHAPVEALIEALDDEDGSVRVAALRVLARVRGRIPPEPLAHMLRDTDPQVREAVALTLEELGEQAPQGPLVARLHEEKAVECEVAQMPGKPSYPDVPPSLPFTLRSAMHIEVMGDRYQLQEPIGRGGMATIYRGRDVHKERVVAVKVLREAYSTDVKSVARFQREAKAASSLQHPNIVQVYDYGQTNGKYYLVMELVEGINLHSYLHAHGMLDVDRSVIIAHDVALGLGAAHRRGIVHRDVKPQNILVGRDGSIKLTDFGIAWVKEDNAKRLTTTGMTLGTVHYYAPEQAQGEIVSPAADVYALGIVMYEMLTGHTPFDGDNPVVVAMQHIQDAPIPPRQCNPSIPAALEEMMLRCLEKVPEMRFRDGSQLARALAMLGDAQLGESVPVIPGQAAMPAIAPHIPSRPSTSGRGGTIHTVPPGSPASSPAKEMGPGVPSDQHDADHVPGSLAHQPVSPLQQSFAPPPGPAASYRFRRGTVPRSGVVQPDRRDSRFASMITLRMLLAPLFLLGCSAYLAVQLGFIPFLSFSSGLPAHGLIEVPDLHHMRWSDARAQAEKAGFRLVSVTGQTGGLVVGQNPQAHEKATKGSTLEVRMELLTTTVPPLPLERRLAPVDGEGWWSGSHLASTYSNALVSHYWGYS
jgi:eukaryotic-like serine/threonine-protein kinase